MMAADRPRAQDEVGVAALDRPQEARQLSRILAAVAVEEGGHLRVGGEGARTPAAQAAP